MPDLVYKIKFQMASLGKQIQDTVSKMKPMKLPVAPGNDPVKAYFESISAKKEKEPPKTPDEIFADIAKNYKPNKANNAFSKMMEGLANRTTDSMGAMKDSWSRFNAELSDSSSMSDALGAFRGLGDGVVKSFTTMAKPIAGWILLAAGLTKTLTDAAKELEDSQNRLNQAFKGGGRMKGVGAEKYTGMYSFSEDQTMQGNINRAGFLKSMARVRSSAFSLDEKTFDKAMQQSIDLGAYLGVDKGEALEQYAEILNGLNFTYEDGIKLGTEFSRSEISMIDALKQAGNQAEANAIIMRKVAKQTKGAQDEYMSTLSGKWEQFGNLISSTLQNLGTILMPIMKRTLDFANLILKIINFASKILADMYNGPGKALGKFLKDLTGYDFGFGTKPKPQNQNQNENENWIDPRLQLNTRFEGAESIVKNIQKGIMDQSPQAKMVNYLKAINGKLDKVHEVQKKQKENSDKTVEELHEANQKDLAVGLA